MGKFLANRYKNSPNIIWVMGEAAMLTLLNEASTPSWAAKPLWVRSSLSRYPPPLLSVCCQAVYWIFRFGTALCFC